MPNVISAPIPPATATASGVVSTGAQVLGAGVKTFSSGIIANSASVGSPGVSINAGAFNNHSPINVTNIGANAGLNLSFAAGAGGGALNLGDISGLGKALTANNATLNLFSTASGNGQVRVLGEQIGASGVGVIVGTLTADGSVHASAKLLGIYTGIGGVAVESIGVLKGGVVVGGSAVLRLNNTEGAVLDYGGSRVQATSSTAVLRAATTANVFGQIGASASDVCVKVGTNVADGSVHASAKIASFRTGIGGTEVEKAYVAKDGGLWNTNGRLGSFSSANVYVWCDSGAARLVYTSTVLEVLSGVMQLFDGSAYSWKVTNGRVDQSGTDSSGTPGAATINKPSGISAIAGGATTVTITNSLVTASSRVRIDWYGDLGTQTKQPWITRAAGSFTVNVGTAPAGAVAFGWEVSSLI